jgi:signal transduction histidine kinase
MKRGYAPGAAKPGSGGVYGRSIGTERIAPSAGPAEQMTPIFRFVRSIGLTAQFLLLAAVLFAVLAFVTGKLQNHIIAGRMIEGSLEIEQALARGVLLSVLGEEPVRGVLPAAMHDRVHEAVTTQIDRNYIDKVKIWGLDGALVYNSSGPIDSGGELEPAALRAVQGETVIEKADDSTPENLWDGALGTVVYEVYIPLVNRQGQVIAVGEIYCSVELLLARISRMLADTDAVRLGSLLVGIIGLAVLVAFAQRRITAQEAAISESLRKSDALAEANRQLFRESEDLRRQAAQISEAVLNRIGADLHDGPIQLLSIAALYRSQLNHAEAEMPLARKASELLDAALAELRMISTGLVMPTLDGLDLAETLNLAVQNVRSEGGVEVAMDIAPLDLMLDDELRVAVYRIVTEALHNSRNHADGKGMAVQANDMDGLVRIVVSDKGPGFAAGAQGKAEPLSSMAHVSLGLAGMRNRARSVGADLTVNSRPGRGTEIVLLLDRARIETRQGPSADAAEEGAADMRGGAILGAES